MKIDKIYYEELRSVFIDGKWANRKIGIGATLNDESGQLSDHIDDLKIIVRRELDNLNGEYVGGDSEKYAKTKAYLINVATNIKKEIEFIDSGMPF